MMIKSLPALITKTLALKLFHAGIRAWQRQNKVSAAVHINGPKLC